jgi:hypothetical protein
MLAAAGVGVVLFYAWALWKIPDLMHLHAAQDLYNARILVISVGGGVVVGTYGARSLMSVLSLPRRPADPPLSAGWLTPRRVRHFGPVRHSPGARRCRARRPGSRPGQVPTARWGAGSAPNGPSVLNDGGAHGAVEVSEPQWDTSAVRGGASLLGLLYTARTYRLSQRGQITDRFTNALEQLNADQLRRSAVSYTTHQFITTMSSRS